MQQNAFVQSMKTIAQNAITKAGFDKTRNGRIVGVNSVTNTYSVKVDGIVYNNIKVVNDYEYNVGDIVKINIPMNNPSQAYISSSVLSDDSIGKKLADTITLLDELDDKVDSITDIMGDIYQLSVSVSYANSGDYVIATYTAILSKNGEDITSDHDEDEFEWYMEKTTGRTTFDDSPAYSIQLSTEDYYYGQAVLLEWTYTYTDDDGVSQTVQLRYRVTLFSPTTLEGSSKYTTELSSSGVFVHRADGNYDVGNDYESTYAYGVKIADTVDIIKGGYVWGTFGGSYLVVGRTADYYNNIYMNVGGDSSSTGSIQFRNGTTVLSEMTSSSITVGQTSGFNTYIGTSNIYMRYNGTTLANWTSTTLTLGKTSTYNTYITTQGVYLRNGTTNVGSFTASAITLGLTSTYNTYITTSAVNLRYGTTTLAQFNTSGLTLKNSSGYLTFTAGQNAMNLYTGTASNVVLASFGTSGLTLKNSSGYTTFNAGANSINLYTGTASNVALMSINSSSMTLKNSSNTELMYITTNSARIGDLYFYSRNSSGIYGMHWSSTDEYEGDDMNIYVSGHSGYIEASNGVLQLFSSATGVSLGRDSDNFRSVYDDSTKLGTSNYRWSKIYASNSSISTSDKKEKDILGNINFAYDLIMSLRPIQYMWKNGDHHRTRMGFIAQDIAKWCNQHNLNLSLYEASYKDEEENDEHREYYGEDVDDDLLNWGLAYGELIAPMIQVMQNQQKNIENLIKRVEQLEQKEK